MKVKYWLVAMAGAIALLPLAEGQSSVDAGVPPGSAISSMAQSPAQPDLTYVRPTEEVKLKNYFLNAFGPYPIANAALVAGYDQEENAPPEWGQGASGYGRRFASEFGMAAVSTTTRYALAETFREDTMYYRCQCKNGLARLGYALTSTVITRRGDDGHPVFSFASLAAPYAGAMTAVYAWYPNRFGARDGLRMGNYNLLSMAAQNIAMELSHHGPHSLFSRLHLNNSNAAPAPAR